jgi:LPS export ABC transporter protein LptC
MKKMKKSIICVSIAIIVILFIITALFFEKHEEKGILKIISDNADLQVKDFHYTEVGDPDVVWEIDADTAQYFRSESHAAFKNVRVKLVASDGKTYLMTGDEGHMNSETKDIDVHGHVVVTSDSGDRFESEDIHYIYSEKKIVTDSPVMMSNESIKIRGKGLVISIMGKRLALLSNVTATILNWQG